MNQHQFDTWRHRCNVRADKKARAAKRKRTPVVAKPGIRPVSVFHPQHPANLYGFFDVRNANRDRTRWA